MEPLTYRRFQTLHKTNHDLGIQNLLEGSRTPIVFATIRANNFGRSCKLLEWLEIGKPDEIVLPNFAEISSVGF